MKIVFHSRTGNIKRFLRKLDLPNELIKLEEELQLNEPFLLVTYTDKIGKVPEKVTNFLIHNHDQLVGVAASGNKNFGIHFAKSADIIAEQYNVPIVSKFELAGSEKDCLNVRGWVVNYESTSENKASSYTATH